MDAVKPQSFPLGWNHPPDERHAVSVSLPTWEVVVSYRRDEQSLYSDDPSKRKINGGYPRFSIHQSITRLVKSIFDRLGICKTAGLCCMIFPSAAGASRCRDGLNGSSEYVTEIVHFRPAEGCAIEGHPWASFYAVIFPSDKWDDAMSYWRDTGDGISSQHAEFCEQAFDDLESSSSNSSYQTSPDTPTVNEERLAGSITTAELEKQIIKNRIAHLTTSETAGLPPPTSEDVFLFPNGMNGIYTLSRALASIREQAEVVVFGLVYAETRSVLERSNWEKVSYYHQGSQQDLEDLEASLASGRHIQALFCECPGNILLATPDLHRLRELATKYDFIIACDDSVSLAVNTDILPFVDVQMTSLTKMFNGACNVTAGSILINPHSPHYHSITTSLKSIYKDTFFPLDAATLAQNSTDVVDRVHRANNNALAAVSLLSAHPSILTVNHPSTTPTAPLYNRYRRTHGGWGQVLSIVFRNPDSAERFYDALDTCKGTSFGTNFTLAIPFAQLAHFHELDWVERHGVPRHIIRISVGLEDRGEILDVIARALREVEAFEALPTPGNSP